MLKSMRIGVEKMSAKKIRILKSQLKIEWFLAIFVVTVITILVLSRILSNTLSLIFENIAESSSQNVAIQLSSLMSAAGSTPSEIDIYYKPSENILYDVKIASRVVEVYAKFSQPFIKSEPFKSPFCTSFDDYNFKDVNRFYIKKFEKDRKSYYEIYARSE